jgi:hypothetical protein
MGKTKKTNKRGGYAVVPDSVRQKLPAWMRHSTLKQIKEKLKNGIDIEPWEVGFDYLREWKLHPKKYEFSPEDELKLARVFDNKTKEETKKNMEMLAEYRERKQHNLYSADYGVDEYKPNYTKYNGAGRTRRRKGRKGRKSRRSRK